MTPFEEAVLTRLDRIGKGLEAVTQTLLTLGQGEPEACQHPEDQRLEMSSMTEIYWKCRACNYEYLKSRHEAL